MEPPTSRRLPPPPAPGLGSALRRLPPYIYLADLFRGRRVLEIGCGDGTTTHYLAEAGASMALGVDRSANAIEAARGKHRLANLGFRTADYASLELEDRSFDVVCAPLAGDLVRWLGFLEEVRRVLARDGNLILSVPSADRPDARGGVSYHELSTRLAPLYGAVRMIGVTPFVGFSLVEFADEEEIGELELDTSMTALGSGRDTITDYVALAGPYQGPARGFMIVELPPGEGLEVVAGARGEEAGATAPPAAGDPEVRKRLARAVEDRNAAEAETQQLRQRLERAEEEVGRVTAQAAIELEDARRQARSAEIRAGELEIRLSEQAEARLAEQAQPVSPRALEAQIRPHSRPQTLPGIAPVLIPPAGPAEVSSSILETQLRERDEDLARLASERQALEWRASELEGRIATLEDEARAREAELEAVPAQPTGELMARAAEAHEKESQALRHALEELRAENDELRARDFETVIADARSAAAAADQRSDELERENRAIRQRLAEAEGKLLGETLQAGPPPAAPADDERIHSLEEALAVQTAAAVKATAAAETAASRWKAAEAKTDELWRKIGEMQRELEQNREQGVETARAQRQAAQVALTRAVDEASKKLVSAKDELLRANKEIALKTADNDRLRAELDELAARSASEHASAMATPLAVAGLASRLEEVLQVIQTVDQGLAQEERRLDRLGGALAALRGDRVAPPEEQEQPPPEVAAEDVYLRTPPVYETPMAAAWEAAEPGAMEQAGAVEQPPAEAAPLDPELEAWIQGREQRVQELSAELGQRDAELALLHGVLAGARQRIADMIDLIQRTCDELTGRDEPASQPASAASERVP
jgi:SAM-dependent methyltransferase